MRELVELSETWSKDTRGKNQEKDWQPFKMVVALV